MKESLSSEYNPQYETNGSSDYIDSVFLVTNETKKVVVGAFWEFMDAKEYADTLAEENNKDSYYVVIMNVM